MNSAKGHVPALDGLRGIAILLVIPHNGDLFSGVTGWLWPVAMLVHAGWTGVQLFFVLSGYLITGGLLDTLGTSNYYRVFYARRALRIFPLYFLVLLVFLVLLPMLVPLGAEVLSTYHHQIWLWLFLSNWTQPFQGTVYWFSHFWSLAVEEQFYLVWPLAIALVSRRHLPVLCAAVVVMAIACRLFLLHLNADPKVAYMITTARMDALALGALAALLARSPTFTAFVHRQGMALLGVALILLAATGIATHEFETTRPAMISVGYTTLAAAAALIMVVAGEPGAGPAWLRRLLSADWLRSVGRYSYAMYIFHMLLLLTLGDAVHRLLLPIGALFPVLYALVIVLLSYAAGWLSYHGFEKHFLRLKRHFVARCDPSHTSSGTGQPIIRD